MSKNRNKRKSRRQGRIQKPTRPFVEAPVLSQVDERDQAARLIRTVMNYYNSGPEVEGLIREILTTDKDTFDTLQMLGIKEGERGHYAEAEALIRQALKINKASAMTFNNLGVILIRRGKPDEAVESYLKALELKPEFVEAHFNLGATLREQGLLSEAVERYQKAVELKPDYAEAYCHLGATLRERGALSEAIEICQRAVELKPDYAEAYCNLGNALREQGALSEAMESCQKAVDLKPDYAEIYFNLEAGLRTQGALSEAVDNCLKVVRLKPDFAMAHNNLGNALRELGKLSEASESYLKAMELNPEYALAYSNYVTCRKFVLEDQALADHLEALLSNAKMEEDRSNLHFALGKLYDDFGKYDASFQNYYYFNQIERKKCAYHWEYFSSYVDRLISTFPAGYNRTRQWTGSKSELPVFILGMPRSGTTLIEQIISSHPLVYGAGELSCLDEIVQRVKAKHKTSYPECLKSLVIDDLKESADFYLDYLRGFLNNSLRITDKMPRNFLHLGFISLLFQKPRIIHCRRSPLDTCLSIFFQRFSRRGHPYSYDLVELGHYYLDYERLMSHWRKVLPPGMMLEVRYEEVLERPEEMSRKLMAFCGLEWDERCLKFHENERAVNTSSSWQVRQPLYKTSKERWRNYENHLAPLQRVLAGKVD